MMPTPRTTTEVLIHEMGVSEEELVRKAVERGGLPTEAEEAALVRALNDAQAELESITTRVEWIAQADASAIPFDVSLEHLGVLAVLVSDVENRIDDFARDAKLIRGWLGSLAAIREEQNFFARQHERSDG
jgi:hypothetical protein